MLQDIKIGRKHASLQSIFRFRSDYTFHCNASFLGCYGSIGNSGGSARYDAQKKCKILFENAKKAKQAATRELSSGEKVTIIAKTVASDIMTSSEFCTFQRRAAHLLGMYGTIIFWVTSAMLIFSYSTPSSIAPAMLPMLWHIGALMTCIGGFWFWFSIRVNVR